jgi:outer membrane lipopolysaccharide assembly protein LptE/RlpB
MNRRGTLNIILVAAAAVLLFIGGLAACGWAFDDSNLAGLGFFAAAAYVASLLP